MAERLDTEEARTLALRELMGSIGSVAQAGAEAGEFDTRALELPDSVFDRAAEIEKSRLAE